MSFEEDMKQILRTIDLLFPINSLVIRKVGKVDDGSAGNRGRQLDAGGLSDGNASAQILKEN